MIHTAHAVRTLKAVAMAIGFAILLWSTGLPAIFQEVEAASLTSASDTMSNTAPSANAVHTIGFTTPNGMATGEIFAITFPDQFDLSSLNIGDISMTVNGDATSTAGTAAAGVWGIVKGDHFLSFETPSDAAKVASSSSLVITIGDELNTTIVNPSATTTYTINIGTDSATTTMQDSGSVMVAIMDEVTVSASIDTTLQFDVSGVASGQSVNGSPTSTAAGTTNTTLPFGTLSASQSKTLAQDLSVSTNAAHGFTVAVVTSGDLQSSTGATIDGFIDGTSTDTPTAWVGPSAVPSQTDTYGHWGMTSDDVSLFGSDLWISPSTTPRTVFDVSGPASATTTRVGYQIEISALQEAGGDYTTSLRYIATPTF